MKRRDLKIIDERMERISNIVKEMVGETDQVTLADLRFEIASLAGGTRGIVTFYLTLED